MYFVINETIDICRLLRNCDNIILIESTLNTLTNYVISCYYLFSIFIFLYYYNLSQQTYYISIRNYNYRYIFHIF